MAARCEVLNFSQERTAFCELSLGPLAFEQGDLDVGGFGLLHARGTVLGGGIFRGSLNVQHRAAVGQQSGELPALDAPDFHVIGSKRKNRNARSLAQLGHVRGFAIENHPSDTGAGRGAGHLGKSGATDRLENDGMGTKRGGGLHGFEDLRALVDGVVVGVDNLQFDIEFAGGEFGGFRLLNLVVVVAGGQRNQKTEFAHLARSNAPE